MSIREGRPRADLQHQPGDDARGRELDRGAARRVGAPPGPARRVTSPRTRDRQKGEEMSERSTEHGTIVIERSYPAPPPRVFAAWASMRGEVEVVRAAGARPDGLELDFRIGGAERFDAEGPDGARYTYLALYQDIVLDERIVYTYEMYRDDDRISVSVSTVELEPPTAGPPDANRAGRVPRRPRHDGPARARHRELIELSEAVGRERPRERPTPPAGDTARSLGGAVRAVRGDADDRPRRDGRERRAALDPGTSCTSRARAWPGSSTPT